MWHIYTHYKKPPDQNEVMSRCDLHTGGGQKVFSTISLSRDEHEYEINMHNADTVLDKAPGQEAFCTVIGKDN